MRKRATNWKERAEACYQARRKKGKKMREICEILARKGCIKSSGSLMKRKQCQRAYSMMMKHSFVTKGGAILIRTAPKADRRRR